MSIWPSGAKEILAQLDGEPRARSDLLLASGVDQDDWSTAINFLLDEGYAIRSGTKRGTRYVSARPGMTRAHVRDSLQVVSYQGYVQAAVAEPYHDIVSELLAELGHGDVEPLPMETPVWTRSEQRYDEPRTRPFAVAESATAPRYSVPPSGGDESLRQTTGPARRLEAPSPDDEDADTDEVCRITVLLRSLGISRIIDQREKNGCLWVLEGPGVPAAVKRVERQLGVQFHLKPEGSRSTGGLAAWWTKGE